MSNNELIPLFPSATHPAIPVASQILSTLRHLTAPGKGNDMRAEERAALVGVSALLGCEKVQSRDLVESSAQKASSVSPSHFRSALQHARRILQTQSAATTSTSPSTRRSSRSSSNGESSQAQSGSGPMVDPLSPFSTPKKRFKYSSGVDLSGLVRSGRHSPAQSSPLKNSVTPSRLRGQNRARPNDGDDRDGPEEADEEGDVRTPTKRAKFGLKQGVDLEKEVGNIPDLDGGRPQRSTAKKGESSSAFFALRDGAPSGATAGGARGNDKAVEFGDGERNAAASAQRRLERREEGRKTGGKRRKRDWTYSEVVWYSDALRSANQAVLDKVSEGPCPQSRVSAAAWIRYGKSYQIISKHDRHLSG